MSLFDSFFGGSQKDRISDASAQAGNLYRQGYDRFVDTTQDYLGKSLNPYQDLQPSIQQGQGANRLLSDALGVNGPEAQSLFYSGFQNDPGFDAANRYGIRSADMGAAARGHVRSGGQQRDLFEYGQKNLLGLFQNRLAGLAGLGQRGDATNLASVTGRSGLYANAGNRIADAGFGTNQLLAGNEINTGNALAQADGIALNNILAVANTAAKFVNPMGGGGGASGANFGAPGGGYYGSGGTLFPGPGYYPR